MSWRQHAPKDQRKSLEFAFYSNTVRKGGLESRQLVEASSSLPQVATVCHGSLMSSTGSYVEHFWYSGRWISQLSVTGNLRPKT